MTVHREEELSRVPFAARPTRETLFPLWDHVEHGVWTERMLTALVRGVQGGRWFRLIDKVYAGRTLMVAAEKVTSKETAAGVDHITTKAFAAHLDEEVRKLGEALRTGAYRPQAVRRTWIPKGGTKELRPLGIPTVRDRVVQTAVKLVIEPIFEREFAEHSYGFRPGRGCKDALRRVDELLKQGYHYVVDADLKQFFDTIPHEGLLQRLQERIADGKVLSLVESFLKAGILEGMREWTPEEGAPQGAVISPLLSNIYLHPLDQMMAERGWEMVRYADDFVILCKTQAEAEEALGQVRAWVSDNGLSLHETKTKVMDVREAGFDFLGYHFVKHRRFPKKKSLAKFRDAIRELTPRNSGKSLSEIVSKLNEKLRGWHVYFKQAWWTVFRDQDSWVRGRLRSLLRRRSKRRGRGRGADHQRWPNAFFAKCGLYSLKEAHTLACQSSSR
jgi:RNA-directed DNA polymerase